MEDAMADAARTPTPTRMTAAEFLAWSHDWEEGERFELIDGFVVRLSAERSRHALVKSDVDGELKRAAAAAGLPCTVWPDGMAVPVDDGAVLEPHAAVSCGPVDLDALAVRDPVIVVEVPSPTSRGMDTGLKLTAYFNLPSLAHYLVVDPVKKLVTRHSRRADGGAEGGIDTAILREGTIRLDPPGLEAALERFFARV
jgi:Uma2 family endonuclease